MNKLRTLLNTLVLVLGILLTSCGSPPVEPDEALVTVELILNTELVGSGNGIIIHSSEERGTYILTVAHNISTRFEVEGTDLIGVFVYNSAFVRFRDGTSLPCETVYVDYDTEVLENGLILWRDIAILHVQTHGLKKVKGINRAPMMYGDQVEIWSLCPREVPIKRNGTIEYPLPELYFNWLMSVSEEVELGNSGSPIFVDDGLLSGLVWGRNKKVLDDKGTEDEADDEIVWYAYFIQTNAILEALSKANLEFILD